MISPFMIAVGELVRRKMGRRKREEILDLESPYRN
jgi:hypothetical protein